MNVKNQTEQKNNCPSCNFFPPQMKISVMEMIAA